LEAIREKISGFVRAFSDTRNFEDMPIIGIGFSADSLRQGGRISYLVKSG
jgi:hypothetical protein